jgi:hypothetical protein
MFTEDLTAFINTDDFAVTVNLDGSMVNGILAIEPVESNFVQTDKPVFRYAKTDKPYLSVGANLIYDSIVYVVRNIEYDGTGIQSLTLEEQDG